MVVANGHPRPAAADPMLKAVGEVVAKELARRDERIAELGREADELRERVKELPRSLEISNHVDTAGYANALTLLGDRVGRALELMRPPTVEGDTIHVAPAQVNFDLALLTKALERVVEHSLDQPLPAVNFPTARLEKVLKDALAFRAPAPDVNVSTDLSALSTALQSLADSQVRQTEALEDVAKLLAATAKRLDRLERAVSEPRPKRELRIVHGEESSTVEEI